MNYEGVGVYSHFDGKEYNVMGLATQTETGEVFVIGALFGDRDPRQHFACPLDDFNSTVQGAPRFRLKLKA